jgi:hypothetical protein
MTIDLRDIRSTIIPRSDQLNFDQLILGPVVVTVTHVTAGNAEQPIVVHYEGENGRPYKPGLTMRRILALGWGSDSEQWVGRSMELYGDPTIRFGKETVGGIRISRMSHIPKAIEASLAVTKGKKAMNRVEPLRMSEALQTAMSAIASATDNATMKAAKALATKLTAPADVEIALAAYTKKVAELKAAAAPKTDSAFDLVAYTKRIEACTDLAMLQVMSDEAEAMPEGPDREAVMVALLKRDAELG